MSLTVENLSFGYGRKTILEEVSLEVPEGGVMALLGPNGTGKTTLLKAIGQILKPSSGSCLVDGKSLSDMDRKQRARTVSYVPQSISGSFPIRAADFVMMGRQPFMGFSPSQVDKELVFSAIKRMGIEDFAFTDMNEMSGGERQRVLIARALVQQPRLLLLDEPTSSMDLKNQLSTMELVFQLAKEQQLTVVMSIHDLNLAAMFCSLFLLLKDCRRFAGGTAAEVLTEKNIQAVYGVETEVVSYEGYPHIMLKKQTVSVIPAGSLIN